MCLALASSLFAQSLEIDNIKNEIRLHLESTQQDKELLDSLSNKKLIESEVNALDEALKLKNKQLVFQKNYLQNKIDFTSTALKRLSDKAADLTQELNKREQHSKQYWNSLLGEYRQYLEVIEKQLQINQALQEAVRGQLEILERRQIVEQSEDEIAKLNKEIKQLNQDNEVLLRQDLSQLAHSSTLSKDRRSDLYIDLKQGQISLNQLAIELIRVDKNFKLLDLKLINEPAYSEMEGLLTEVNLLKEKLSNIHNSLQWIKNYQVDKKSFVESSQKNGTISKAQSRVLLSNVDALLNKVNALLSRLFKLSSEVQKSSQNLIQQTKEKLKSRQTVFISDLDSIRTLFSELYKFTNVVAKYGAGLATAIATSFLGLNWLSFVSVFILGLFLIVFRLTGLLAIELLIEKEKRAGFSFTLFDFSLLIIKRNWFGVWICLSFLVFSLFIGLSYNVIKPVVGLCLVWFIFRFAHALSRILLLERISDASGADVRLFHHLKIVLIVGGLISALTVLSHNLATTDLIRELFYRLFMGFLLIASSVLYISRNVVPSILPKSVRKTRPYLSKAVGVFSSILPLGIFACALIGIIGFLNLAWILSGYLAIAISLLALYILARGLLIDAMSLLSEQVIKRLNNGWVISEVFLKPIDALSRLFLMAVFIFLLIVSLGLSSSYTFHKEVQHVLMFHLVNVNSISITVKSFMEFLFLCFFFFWLVKWSYEFCYRYLFRNIRDLGIRNSLSTFTQYAVLTLGVVFALRVLGIDLTGMSYVLGGLAVGMGFGLRDFASNIVGGIILLIERPLREGDVVAFDNFEGRVEHIGIRSIRMRSWDNMQVLVPNSETFNKPFTNWTHQDSIVRTVVPIKIHRSDSPMQIQSLIMEVLEIIPEVLKTPEPQVLLKNIDEVLYEFELRYYINIENSQRTTVRSTVLFALSSQFKAAGIKEPVPSLQIEQLTPKESN